jgi:hypothetical protein
MDKKKGTTKRGLFNILKPRNHMMKATKNNAGCTSLQTARGTGLPYEASGYHCSSNTPRWLLSVDLKKTHQKTT